MFICGDEAGNLCFDMLLLIAVMHDYHILYFLTSLDNGVAFINVTLAVSENSFI
jgi:hypothetical protein